MKGVNVNVMDQYRCTPLHCAAINGQTEICQMLLNAGAVVSKVNIASLRLLSTLGNYYCSSIITSS